MGSVTSIYAAISPLHNALDFHLDRQNLLTTNVAHVDTPNYVPRDLKRPNPFGQTLDVAMARADERHMAAPDTSGVRESDIFTDSAGGGGYDGNFVSLDREAAKLAENQSRYDVVTTAVGAQLRLLSFAANDGTSA